MQIIFIDEAGTSPRENETIVVGIVFGGHLLHEVEFEIQRLLATVPPSISKDFLYSTKDVLDGNKYQDRWQLSDRLKLVEQMMSLPRRLGICICLARLKRVGNDELDRFRGPYTVPKWHHAIAFQQCLALAEFFIKNTCAPDEIAQVVAEDLPKMRWLLTVVGETLRDNPLTAKFTLLANPKLNGEVITTKQRIARDICFVKKNQAIPTYLADACAYAFRRFFEGQRYGDKYSADVLGKPLPLKERDRHSSFLVYPRGLIDY